VTDISSPGRRRQALVALGLLASFVLLYFFVDAPLARVTVPFKDHQPRVIDDLFEFVRLFGQLLSVILAAALILSLDPARRNELVRLLIAVALAAAAVNILKMVIGRARPEAFAAGRKMWSFFAGFHETGYTSFPSAHTAGAFALAAPLSAMYPRARHVFYALAILCAISRVGDAQHYASDAVAGAALGLWLGSGAFRWRWVGRLASRIVPSNENAS